jgi:hypothetical protein
MTKVIYLKTLFKDFKPDATVTKLIDDTIHKANGIDDVLYMKHLEKLVENKEDEAKAGRKFILNNMEKFLCYAVDYSILDKAKEWLAE